jgi:hypothetical protein
MEEELNMKSVILSLMILSMLMAFASSGTVQLKNIEGLVAYYNFDGGSMKDMSGKGHDGKLAGGAAFVKDDGAPVPNGKGCVEFKKQAGNAVDCGPGEKFEKNITLMAWEKVNDAAPCQYVAGTPYDDGGAWDAPWIAYNIGVRGGKMATWLNISAVDAEYDSGVVKAGEWTHICFTFDGNDSISYVNGEEVAKMPRKGKIEYDGEPHFMIGERSHSCVGEPFGGWIDEVALFNRVLTLNEIKQAMEGGLNLAVQYGGKLTTTWGNIKRL